MDDLTTLIAFTAQAAPATPENYPELAALTDEGTFKFMLSHSLRHTDKSTGRLQTFLEAYEHGNTSALNREAIQKEAVKFVFNALRIVELLGLTGDQVAEMMRSQFKVRA